MDPFQIPENAADLSAEELAAAIEQARAEFQDLYDDRENLTDEQLDRADALGAFLQTAVATQNEAAEARAARLSRLDDAASALSPADEADEDDEDPEDDTDIDQNEDETPAPEAEVEAPAPVVERQAASLVSTTRRPRNPRPATRTAPRPNRLVVTAAAGMNNFTPGAPLPNIDEVSAAFIDRSSGFPEGQPYSGPRMQYRVAQFAREYNDGLVQDNGQFANDESLIRESMRESRLPGGSLVAAGGWCAPSETDYSLPPLMASRDGIIDLPEFGVRRGGIRTTLGPDFSDIYTSAGFAQTEAQAISGTTKACVDIDCPDFVETRLDAVGICVRAPILTRTAYPEVISNYIQGTMVANDHKVATRVINAMKTALGSIVTTYTDSGAVSLSTFEILALTAEGQRNKYRMPDNATFEVKMPHWLKVALMLDFAKREGVGLEVVTDSFIREQFAAHSLVPQFVYNLDDAEILEAACLTDIPDTADVLIYPAGTFGKGTADVINLDTVYDTAGLQVNTYTAAFVEDGVLVVRRGYGGCLVRLPVKISGKLGPLTAAEFNATDT